MAQSRLVRHLRNGQITIPKEFRDAMGLRDNDMLRVSFDGDRLQIEPVDAKPRVGSPWLKEMYEAFAPVRESLKGYSEEEINDAIDDALREVRRKNAQQRRTA
jgi:AbrB family looped-hinge helix DNA binding protein